MFTLWYAQLDSPYWISEFRVSFRNQKPQQPPSTNFRPNQVNFFNFMYAIVYPPFLISKFGVQISIQRPEKPLGTNFCENSSSQSQKNRCTPNGVNARF